jgi:hypothetical protein
MTRFRGWRYSLLSGLLLVTLLGGCERKMLDHVCTPVDSGELVISEIRGPQTAVDTYGQWIELHNSSPVALNLAGVKLRMTQLDGSSEKIIMIRDEALTVPAGGYVVLGHQPRDQLPDHVDYGYDEDLTSDLYADGILELYVCNELVDFVLYRGLPTLGSLAFDGALELTAANNDNADLTDFETTWCNDASEVPSPTEVGIPGTPGEQNRPCN